MSRFSPRPLLAVLLLIVGGAGACGAATPNQALAIYEPFRVEAAALAPDGQHVAFALREGRKITLHIFDTADAGKKVRLVFEDQSAAHVALLEWVTPDKLIAMTDAPFVISTDAKGEKVYTLLEPRTFVTDQFPMPRAMRVLGVPPDDRGGLMLETTGAPDRSDVTLSLVRLDLATGQRRVMHSKALAAPGGSLLLDQQGRPRVLLMRGESPQRFFHLAEGGGPSDWKPMDRRWPDVGGGFVISPQNFTGRRAIPLGFDRDPSTLFFASNAGRDTFGIYALDLRAGGKVRTIAEDEHADLADPSSSVASGLMIDPARQTLAGVRWPGDEGTTRWIDAQLAETQAKVDAQFPGRHVSLLGWDAERARVLVLAGGDDGGRYFVFHRADERSVEYFRRTRIEAEDANHSERLTVALPGGGQLTGTVVLPRHPPVAKPALVIWFHDGPWQRIEPGFQRDAEALATMGFVVVQFDYRGSTGYGLNHREAIRGAFDRVPVADALAALEAVAARHAFDRKRVAVGGEGFGGFLALRALELHPDIFRCGVAINAPLELGQLRESARAVEQRRRQFLVDVTRWNLERNRAIASPEVKVVVEPINFKRLLDRPGPAANVLGFDHEVARAYFGGEAQLAKFAVEGERLTRAVLFLHDPANTDLSIMPVQSLVNALVRRKQTAEVVPLSPQFALGQPAAHAAAFRRIGEFLNANLYDFKVEIGDPREKEGPP